MSIKLNNKNRQLQDPDNKNAIDEVINDNSPITPDPVKDDDGDAVVDDTPIEPDPEPTPEVVEKKEEKKEPTPPAKPEPDYKEKYKNSSKEAMVLYSKNKKINDAVEEAANLPAPSYEEMKDYAGVKGVNYDDLDDYNKSMLQDSYVNKRRFDMIHEASRETKRLDQWVDTIDDYVESEDVANNFPVLVEAAGEFKDFCMKNTRRFQDLKDLTAAFLYQYEASPKSSHRGSLLLNGGRGAVEPDKPIALNEDDISLIRKTDPKEYRRLLKAGKVKLEV
jgi:hypothetical protein